MMPIYSPLKNDILAWTLHKALLGTQNTCCLWRAHSAWHNQWQVNDCATASGEIASETSDDDP